MSVSGASIYLQPGMQVKLKIDLVAKNGFGWFARTEDLPQNYFGDNIIRTLVNGFVSEDESVGTLSLPTDETGAVAIYTHNKSANNTIWFFALTGERTLVNIVSIPIHDHSSIVQGGPAYGTYYSDDANPSL